MFPGKGRGLCARAPIAAGQLIESAPVLVLSDVDRRQVCDTVLRHYYFHWQDEDDSETCWSAALAMGRISLCNHARPANGRFQLRHDVLRIDLFAAVDIAAGDEITIDYDCALWFEDRN